MKLDAKRREYDIIVIGEEGHLAYNRVGLTSFFQHRKVENLYLNPREWVSLSTPMKSRASLTTHTVLCLPRRLPELPPEHESHRNPPQTQTRFLLLGRDGPL
jgi:nitrite reductase (NAD(P)H)